MFSNHQAIFSILITVLSAFEASLTAINPEVIYTCKHLDVPRNKQKAVAFIFFVLRQMCFEKDC